MAKKIRLINSVYSITKNRHDKIDKEVKHKIYVYTFCYNEQDIIPFAIDYWKRFATKVIVYDNYSTDDSVKLLSKEDFIEIRKFTYPNGIDDFQLRNMKNNIWKECRYVADYVVVCDMDEMLYSNNFVELFEYMDKNDIIIAEPYGIQLVSEIFPEYDNKLLLHNIINNGFYDKRFSKCVLFNPNKVSEINYDFGCHYCYSDSKKNIIKNLFLFHAKYIGIDNFVNKTEKSGERLSNINIEKNFGFEYKYTKEVKVNDFKALVKKSNPINGIINKDRYYINGNYSYNRRLCLIVVPIYRDLTEEDDFSLNNLIDILGRDHDICLMYPERIDITKIENKYGHINFIKLCLPNECFSGKESYSKLCLSSKFYNTFDDFKYILIHQLDAIVFYNALDYFCMLDYDYIGAPHMVEDLIKNTKSKEYSVGNGGFSLRKIEKMSEICKDIIYDGVSYEDVVISELNKDKLNLPSNEVGFSFSIQEEKEKNLKELGHLPFGCHYYKWDNFWENKMLNKN